MDFNFSDDQEMLRDSVRKWVDKGYDFERRKTIVKSGGFSRDAWREIADLGLTGLYVPEAQGGMGFGPPGAVEPRARAMFHLSPRLRDLASASIRRFAAAPVSPRLMANQPSPCRAWTIPRRSPSSWHSASALERDSCAASISPISH